MADTRPDRRQFYRISSKLTTRYTVRETGHTHQALTKNVGEGGICFVATGSVKEGQDLDMEITLPIRNAPIKFSGRVVWPPVPTANNPKYHEVGIQYLEIDDRERALMVQWARMNALPEAE